MFGRRFSVLSKLPRLRMFAGHTLGSSSNPSSSSPFPTVSPRPSRPSLQTAPSPSKRLHLFNVSVVVGGPLGSGIGRVERCCSKDAAFRLLCLCFVALRLVLHHHITCQYHMGALCIMNWTKRTVGLALHLCRNAVDPMTTARCLRCVRSDDVRSVASDGRDIFCKPLILQDKDTLHVK